jgi:hypothetical protein
LPRTAIIISDFVACRNAERREPVTSGTADVR